MRRRAGWLLFVLVGCSSAGGVAPASEGAAGAGAAGEEGSGGSGQEGGSGGGPVVEAGGSTGEALCGDDTSGPAEVYAHSASTLYRIDATTKALTTVGMMPCGDQVIDLAIDRGGQVYGTTFSSLVKIDKATAACQTIRTGTYPNSLSFVPAGTVFPDKEALVGYFESIYVVIDPVTGEVSNKGVLGGGYQSSGDIVSVIGGGTYLTVTGNGCDDCLVSINPSTGDLIEKLGNLKGYPAVYGLAFWAGELYGFTGGGKMFLVDLAIKQTSPVTIPNAPQFLSFYGAGSSTCARLSPIQ